MRRSRKVVQGRFRITPQIGFNFSGELLVDNFAGGGGASTGIEAAMGRPVDISINHDPDAVAMHLVNHPHTKHYCESVWDIDPVKACDGRPVGLAWFSPDCKHFSKAKGGKPVEKKIRGLAWVVLRWAAKVKPRVICLENVEEFTTWGPLVRKKVVMDMSDREWDKWYEDGQSVQYKEEFYPDPKKRGRTFSSFVNALRRHGYDVEYRELRACDYGAPTIRKRFFLVARCDGQAIRWPEPSHGDPKSADVKAGKLKPWRTAAECIDWSIPCPSIFDRKRPLADATLRRIAKGIMRYVVNSSEPFIVPLTHQGKRKNHDINEPFSTVTAAHRGELALVTPFLTEHANASTQRNFDIADPLRTQCAQVKGGHFALVSPTLVGCGGRMGQSPPRGVDTPFQTLTAKADSCVVSAFLAKHYSGVVGSDLDDPTGTVTTIDHHSLVAASLVRHFGESVGSSPAEPVGTVTAGGMGKTGIVAAHLARHFSKSFGAAADDPSGTITGKSKESLVTSHLVKLRGTCQDGQPVTEPAPTVTASGTHVGEVRAFLLKYYGADQDPRLNEPLHTVTTRDRFGLVTVHGEEYQIVDIGMRMLNPRELFRAQGFSEDYIIDRDADYKPITKTAQVARCGNSVCPPIAEALVGANMSVASVDLEAERSRDTA